MIYEDEHVAMVNKPAGMLSQKAKPSDQSLVEYFQRYLLDTGAISEQELETFIRLRVTGWTGIPAAGAVRKEPCGAAGHYPSTETAKR